MFDRNVADLPLSGRIFSLPVILMPIPLCTKRTAKKGNEAFSQYKPHKPITHCTAVCAITLGVLCGDKGLDESIGALGVEGEGVTQGRQFRTLLDKRLFQPVSSSVEVLLNEKRTRMKTTCCHPPLTEQTRRSSTIFTFITAGGVLSSHSCMKAVTQ